MTLTVDIGNTTISIGVVHKQKVIAHECFDTSLVRLHLRSCIAEVLENFHKKGYTFKAGIVCSVVPKVTVKVKQLLHKLLNIDIKVVGSDVVVPMKNCYENPRQVGQDRLVGAYAAMHLYGKPIIVIDLGTAITFDVVSKKGEYLGGVIVPGLRLSAESLFLKTALLPKIDLAAPKSVVGKTTQESILSGLFYGYGSLCRGLIDLISKDLGAKSKVVMTGGHIHLMKKFIAPQVRIIDESLVHKGMALLVRS